MGSFVNFNESVSGDCWMSLIVTQNKCELVSRFARLVFWAKDVVALTRRHVFQHENTV